MTRPFQGDSYLVLKANGCFFAELNASGPSIFQSRENAKKTLAKFPAIKGARILRVVPASTPGASFYGGWHYFEAGKE